MNMEEIKAEVKATCIELLRQTYWYAAKYSKDPSTQNAALVWDPYQKKVVGQSENRLMYYLPLSRHNEVWNNRALKYNRVIHAECAAINEVYRGLRGVVVGDWLVCPWATCRVCASHIADSGISTLVRHWPMHEQFEYTPGKIDWKKEVEIADEILQDAAVRIITITEPLSMELLKIRVSGKEWSP